MSLKGSLQTVALPEVLQFLSSTGKSGEFHVAGSQGEGRLWFDDGRIAGFDAGASTEAFEAIFELLRIEDGEFTFSAEVDRPVEAHGGGDGDLGRALEAAETRLAEWRDIVAVVPSLRHHVQLRAEAPAEGVMLEPAQWSLVVAIAAGRSVGQVLDTREMPEFEGCKAIRVLVDAALAEIDEPETDDVDRPVHHDATDTDDVANADDVADTDEIADTHEVAADEMGADDLHEPAETELAETELAETEPVEAEAEATVEDPSVMAVAEVDDEAVAGDFETEVVAETEVEEEVNEEPFAENPGIDGIASLSGSLLRFGVDPPVERHDAEESTLDPGELSFSHFPVVSETADERAEDTHDEVRQDPAEDRYAALRAAMVEVGEVLVSEPAEPEVETDHAAPVYAIDEQPEVDGRAALQALLSEVAAPGDDEPVHEEPVDGLADRGPWTDHELATMDAEPGWSHEEQERPSNIFPFTSPHADPAARVEAVAEPESEEPEAETHPGEEPINRGLLLKFLSSVRN